MAWTTTRRLFAALAVAILAGLLLTLIVFVLSLALMLATKVNPTWLILAAGVVGVVVRAGL